MEFDFDELTEKQQTAVLKARDGKEVTNKQYLRGLIIGLVLLAALVLGYNGIISPKISDTIYPFLWVFVVCSFVCIGMIVLVLIILAVPSIDRKDVDSYYFSDAVLSISFPSTLRKISRLNDVVLAFTMTYTGHYVLGPVWLVSAMFGIFACSLTAARIQNRLKEIEDKDESEISDEDIDDLPESIKRVIKRGE